MTEPTAAPQPEPTPEQEAFVAAYAAELAAVQKLTQDNEHALAALARQGAGIDMGAVLHLRIMLLLDFTLGRIEDGWIAIGPYGPRLAYERAVQENIAARLANIQQQVTRNTLLQGVQLPVNGKRVR